MDSVFDLGIKCPKILLPRSDIDLKKWAVIACDQFTSQPEYWQQVKEIVGDSPSTYHMILPEVFLGTKEEDFRIQTTQDIHHGRFTGTGRSHNRQVFVASNLQ